MRYSAPNDGRSDLWQRVLFVLLGAGCVVLCYFAGAYWIGPWLHRARGGQATVTESTVSTPATAGTPNVPPPAAQPSPMGAPKLAGVRIREVPAEALPDSVRVIPSGGGTAGENSLPSEEPEPPSTLEEHPSAPPPPPANLWAPAPSTPAPSRPAGESAPSGGGLQTPQPLNDEPATVGSAPSTAPSGDAFYRVRLPDAFTSREEADAALRAVTERGMSAAVVTDTAGGRKVFRVQLGVYRNRTNAEKLAEQARRAGVTAEVAAPSP